MLSYYVNLGIWYLAIGFGLALIYYYIFRQRAVGKFWGALVVGIVGSFIGALIDYLLKDLIYYLAHINDTLNIFPPLITAVLFLWIFSNISKRQ